MTSFEDILRMHRLQRVELQAWIEHRWVRPRAGAQGPVFDEVDEARIALIRELRQDLMMDDDALEVVMPLLYGYRRLGPNSPSNSTLALTDSCSGSISVAHQPPNSSVYSMSHFMVA